MQKTTFAFEVLIHDDASTDGTADIIREYEKKYPDIIKPIYQTENQYSKGIKNTLTYQFPRAKGKYIAFCEGDDYWTDPYKLQKQADFLEANPEYNLCSHRFKIYNIEDHEWEPELGYYKELFKDEKEGISFDFYFNMDYWIIQVLTVMVRKSAVISVDYSAYDYFRDVHLFYHTLAKGKGYCMNFTGGVYNKHIGGIFSKNDSKYSMQYYVYRELYFNNKSDQRLKYMYNHLFMDKLHEESFNYTLKPVNLLKSSADYLWHGGNVKLWTTNVLWIVRFHLKNKIRKLIRRT